MVDSLKVPLGCFSGEAFLARASVGLFWERPFKEYTPVHVAMNATREVHHLPAASQQRPLSHILNPPGPDPKTSPTDQTPKKKSDSSAVFEAETR